MSQASVAIVGGGPAGMALALALRRHGVVAEIYEARNREAIRADARVLALSHGSRQILDWLGAWDGLEQQNAAAAIRTIHVSHRGGLGRTRITAEELGVAALGQVVSAQALITVLDGLVDEAQIPYHEQQKISAGELQSATAGMAGVLEQHALIAWAEGAVDSRLARQRSYEQYAVLCSATVAQAHAHVAWERFTPDGPVALLPLGGSGSEYAVVLACATGDLEPTLGSSDGEFMALLQTRFGGRQRFVGVGPRAHYPLALRWRDSPVAARQVWLGNAAQTLHPVAGQGFNLALRDVWEFARCAGAAEDMTDPAVLRRYADERQMDRRGVIGFTDSLIDTFGTDFGPLKHARGAGLLALDLLPPLRKFVARRMMFGARGW